MSSCMNVRDNICAYIDNELNTEDKLSFEEHIENCIECHKELREMTRIIGLCTSIPQQELPAEFKAELHEKLMAVADRQTKNTTNIWKKKGFIFTRTIASIAAGALLIFLAGTFVRFGLNSTKSADRSQQSAEMAMAAEKPAAPEDALQDSKVDEDYGTDSVGAAIAEDEVLSFSLSADNIDSVEVDRSAAPDERAASIKMAGLADAETLYSKMSTVTITSDEPEEMVETIRVLAIGNGGEEGVSTIFKIKNEAADAPDAIEMQLSEGVDTMQPKLQFIFPQSNYDQFITVLNDALGAANVQMGAFVSEDVTQLLDNMIKESEVIDEKLQKHQMDNGSTENDEIKKLKIQKEMTDSQIEEMRLGSDLVSVTIYINMK